MDAVRVVLLCVAAALICTSIRVQRPEIATVVSLAVGLFVLFICANSFGTVSESIRRFAQIGWFPSGEMKTLLKAVGITIISELGVQICSDAGESALAGRVRLGTRIVMLAMAMPVVSDLLENVLSLCS